MKKIIASVTCAAFLHSQVLGAAGSPDFWRERAARREKPTQLARLPSAPSAPAVPPLAPLLAREGGALRPVAGMPSWLRDIPASLGSVKEASFPDSAKPLVIHIQDLHDQAAAQKNISGLLAFLSASGLRVAGLEGVSGPLPLDLYRALPDVKTVEVLADHFLETSYLSGPEHAALTAARSLSLRGAEDAGLYRAHVSAFKRASALEERARALTDRLRAELDRASEGFPETVRALHRRSFAYHADGGELTAYVEALAGVPGCDPAAFPAAARFLAAARLEKGVDLGAAEEQRGRLLRALAERLDDASLADLTSAALAYRLGRLTHGAFYARLRALCAAHGLDLGRFPAFARYLEYAASTDGLSPAALLADVDGLERAARRALAADAASREFLEASRDAQLLCQLFRYALPSERWAELRARRPRLARGGAAGLIEPFEDFMRLGLERDAALARNLSALARGEKAVALVTGGFHTAGLTEIWRREKTPFVVLSPRVEAAAGAPEASYLDAFRRDAAPLEKFLAGEKVFLKSAQVVSPESPLNPAFERFWAALYAGESSVGRDLADREAIGREWTALFKDFGSIESLALSGEATEEGGVLRLPLKIAGAGAALELVLQLGPSAETLPEVPGRALREGAFANGRRFRIVVPEKPAAGRERREKAAGWASSRVSRIGRFTVAAAFALALAHLMIARPLNTAGPAVPRTEIGSFFIGSAQAQTGPAPGPVAVALWDPLESTCRHASLSIL